VHEALRFLLNTSPTLHTVILTAKIRAATARLRVQARSPKSASVICVLRRRSSRFLQQTMATPVRRCHHSVRGAHRGWIAGCNWRRWPCKNTQPTRKTPLPKSSSRPLPAVTVRHDYLMTEVLDRQPEPCAIFAPDSYPQPADGSVM